MKVIVLLYLLLCSCMLPAQNVGIGTAHPLRRLHVSGSVIVADSLVIGGSTPRAHLQLPNIFTPKKLVLAGGNTTSLHLFDGFGTDPDALRYQSYDADVDHAFYAGYSADSSVELFRIKGNGRISAGGVFDPPSLFANTDKNMPGSDGIGISNPSITWSMNAQGYVQALYNGSAVPGSNGLAIKIAATNEGSRLFDLSTGPVQDALGTPVFSVLGNGNVGIGVSFPKAQFQLSNTVSNRKVVLYESFNNDHQFYGFGAINSTLRYQVSDVAKDHVFYAATSATNSNELFRIKGNGLIGVGIANPISSIANTAANIADGAFGVAQGSLSWMISTQGYAQALYNQSDMFGSGGLLVKIAGTTDQSILNLCTGATANGPAVTVMNVRADGLTGITGSLSVSGNISKGGGSFKIDHPLDPANKFLYHSFVESPDMMNIYNGNTVTGNDGLSVITLPDYFEALNKDFRYQLTVIGDFAQAIIAKKVAGNKFVIKTDKPNIEVSWQVTGIRHDPYAEKNRIPNSVDKAPNEKGHYLHPEAGTNR